MVVIILCHIPYVTCIWLTDVFDDHYGNGKVLSRATSFSILSSIWLERMNRVLKESLEGNLEFGTFQSFPLDVLDWNFS